VPVEWWDEKPEWAAVSALCRCGKFDVQDYLKRYPDVEQTDIDPVLHFVRHGIKENRYFNCMPDTDFGGSKVNLAYKAFKNGEYEKALKMYEELGERIGVENFAANIAICKKKIKKNELVKYEQINLYPKISVIIPVFNGEKYIRSCIESVLRQNLKDLEILIIDDGSTDQTYSILKHYDDKRIRVFNQENLGSGPSRNKGIDNAKGKYIAFIDSDDIYPNPNSLKLLYDAAEKNNAVICGGSQNKIINDKINNQIDENLIFKYNKIVNFKDYQYDYGYQRFIYRTDFIKDLNIYFPNYRRYQDPIFFVKSMVLADEFYAISDVVYLYRSKYKKINWSKKLIYDFVCGLRDEINISLNNNLYKLYDIIEKRIDDHIDTIIRHKTYEIINVILEIVNIIIAHNKSIPKFFKKICTIEDIFNDIITNNKLCKKLIFTTAKAYSLGYNIEYNDDIEFFTKRLIQNKTYIEISSNSKTNCFLSVIIPAYNVQNTICKSIESVLKQNFFDYEIIIIEDVSTDSTYDICKKFIHYKNINIIKMAKNSGLGAVRNVGIRKSHGDYILFLDSDDWIDADSLYKIREIISSNILCDLYAFSFSLYDSEHNRLFKENNNLPNKIVLGIDALKDYINSNERIWSACSKIYKTSFLRENNIYFPEGILYEDAFFLIKSFFYSKKILYSDVILGIFDRSETRKSIMREKNIRYSNYLSTLKNISLQMQFLKELNNNEDLLINRSKYFTSGHHLDNILKYTYFQIKKYEHEDFECDELKILINNKYIIKNIIKKYCSL